MGGVQLDGTARLNPVVVLGATGSIGLQTLEVAASLGFEVVGLAAGTDAAGLAALARRHPAAAVALADPSESDRDLLSGEFGRRMAFGPQAVRDLAALDSVIVVNGIVGSAGLAPTVAALEAGNRLALANKESLVAGGPVVIEALRRGGGSLIPVDSEHSAVWQCLVGETSEIRRIVLTASGGPFRGRGTEELRAVTVEEALAHPTWNMGPRITIDSATLMNKAFEVIEAHYLFDVAYDQIDVVVHPQSIVHSLVEFTDGSVKAELGDPDMRVPIQYALTYPQRRAGSLPAFDLTKSPLTFEAPDRQTFPCLDLGYRAGRAGGGAPAALNAADEVAVASFLHGALPFLAIPEVVSSVLEEVGSPSVRTVDEVIEVDRFARRAAQRAVEASSSGVRET